MVQCRRIPTFRSKAADSWCGEGFWWGKGNAFPEETIEYRWNDGGIEEEPKK
jgi:hypothetical protein